MHFLPISCLPGTLSAQLALVAYAALVQGADELTGFGYEVVNDAALIGRSMSFTLAVAEGFVAWAASGSGPDDD